MKEIAQADGLLIREMEAVPADFEQVLRWMTDPKTHNARAIACYRKCGFHDCCVVPQREKQDGVLHDSLIMARHA